MADLLSVAPLYLPQMGTISPAPTTKGQDIMEGLLLEQYQNSENLKEYMMAFMAEFDTLFEETYKVHFGRMLEYAEGNQLDVIGIILQQARNVALPTQWFGFLGAPDVDGMSDEANALGGGIFRDENQGDAELVPLSDQVYRKVLKVVALISNRDTISRELAYFCICTLLDQIPRTLKFNDYDNGLGLGRHIIELEIDRRDVSGQGIALISYMSKYFITSGATFILKQVN